jgi:hypothetical protein
MSEKRNIWFGFIGSFSPKFYKEIARQPFARSFGYLILLATFVSLTLSAKYSLEAKPFIEKAAQWVYTEFTEKISEVIPEINIKNGEVSSPAEQPFVKDEWKEFAFVLDTTGKITSLGEYKNGILITKHEFITKYTENGRTKIEKYDLSSVKSLSIIPGKKEGELLILNIEGQAFSLTREKIKRFAEIIGKILLPVMVIIMFLYHLIAKFIQIFFFSLLSSTVNKIHNVKLNYDNLLNIGVFALTPAVVFGVLAEVLDLRIPLLGIIYIGLYSAFLIMGVINSKLKEDEKGAGGIC